MFCVLYPLEYCRESQLLFCCSTLRPRVRTMASSLAADIIGFPCLKRRKEVKRDMERGTVSERIERYFHTVNENNKPRRVRKSHSH